MSTSTENSTVCNSDSDDCKQHSPTFVSSFCTKISNTNHNNFLCHNLNDPESSHKKNKLECRDSSAISNEGSLHSAVVNHNYIENSENTDIHIQHVGTLKTEEICKNVAGANKAVSEPLCLSAGHCRDGANSPSNTAETKSCEYIKSEIIPVMPDTYESSSGENCSTQNEANRQTSSDDDNCYATNSISNFEETGVNENGTANVNIPEKNPAKETDVSICNEGKKENVEESTALSLTCPSSPRTPADKTQDGKLSSELVSLLQEAQRDYTKLKDSETCPALISSLRSALSVALETNKEKNDGTYCCSECPWAFSTRTALKSHLAKVHKKKPLSAGRTEDLYKRNQRLKRSNVVYSRPKPFQCQICKMSFHKRAELVNHGSTHFKQVDLKCNVCGLLFTKKKDFNTHSLVHNRKPVLCEICGKSFSQAGNMKIHLRIHTKEKPYTCEHCGKAYAQSGDLKTHIRVHTDEKPYLCEVCGNLFHSLSHLARHSKVHTKEKPYTCKVCGKSFAHTHHLKKHYRIHTQEKPYNCEICNKAFSRADYLKQHIRVHTKEKPYICKICGKGFSQGGSLKLHQRVHARQGLL